MFSARLTLLALALSASAAPFMKHIVPNPTTQWEAACRSASNNSPQCSNIYVNVPSSTPLTTTNPCDQQNAGDTMVDFAKNLSGDTSEVVRLAQISVQQPRDSSRRAEPSYVRGLPRVASRSSEHASVWRLGSEAVAVQAASIDGGNAAKHKKMKSTNTDADAGAKTITAASTNTTSTTSHTGNGSESVASSDNDDKDRPSDAGTKTITAMSTNATDAASHNDCEPESVVSSNDEDEPEDGPSEITTATADGELTSTIRRVAQRVMQVGVEVLLDNVNMVGFFAVLYLASYYTGLRISWSE